MKEKIKFFALENAIKFNGKGNQGAVIGKILSLHPELKKDMKTLSKQINEIVKEVNSMSLDEQKQAFDKTKKIKKPKRKEKQLGLPDLPKAVMGKVVTRLPPEPSKYNHIGHALSFLINYMYAVKYKGKCLLKFEDTNPEKVTKEYAQAMEQDIHGYLGIKAKVIYISDDMEHMYKEAERLISMKKAYVCFCDRESMQDLRHKGKECKHCKCCKEDNLVEWKNMTAGKYKQGQAVLRLKGDMKSDNHVMRDPVLFRINYAKHFRHGTKYCVWPLYDFENSVEDCKYDVTHILRSSEFGKMRNELQNYIKDLLGYKKQAIVHYGRFNIRRAVTQGREIRKLIEEGKVTGWDDPSLVTLRALNRRGIVKETLYELVNRVGLSLTPTNIDWTIISSINRSILDKKVNRYFFVEDPVKIKVKNAPEQKIKLNLHPDYPKRGKRDFTTLETFHVSRDDYVKFKSGDIIRLMDCLNFEVKSKEYVYHSKNVDEYRKKGKSIIHWLPDQKDLVKVKVRMPDNTIKKGLAESSVNKLKKGDIVQFQRFGFCRLDSKNKFWFTNK